MMTYSYYSTILQIFHMQLHLVLIFLICQDIKLNRSSHATLKKGYYNDGQTSTCTHEKSTIIVSLYIKTYTNPAIPHGNARPTNCIKSRPKLHRHQYNPTSFTCTANAWMFALSERQNSTINYTHCKHVRLGHHITRH